ncbi:MAG: FtsW/RodA/SpoVE family cell cycle protein, partial [Clostridiales bacterium]|nr:FtsW/RodA/SpoVE family cell cycle protein [Clostridiales bacterium]
MRGLKNSIVHFIKGTDWILLFLAIVTSAFGALMVYSAKLHSITSGIPREALVMIIATALGLVTAIVISLIDYDIICKLWFIWAAIGIGLMILVMSPLGVAPPNRPDSQIWIPLGFFYFQPSELVKVLFIITFSTHLSVMKQSINKPLNILLLGLHALVPTLLVMKSGDDGSAAVFICIALAMLFMAGIGWQYILAAVVLVGAAIPLLWFKFFSDYQKQRFIVIVDPEAYPDVAYQQNRGITAICNGGFLGEGLFKGTYTQSGSVPVSESDMIFTVVCEELGFVGGLAAFALIFLIIFKVIRNGRKSTDTATTFMSYGIGAMIASQTIINIAMCLRVG